MICEAVPDSHFYNYGLSYNYNYDPTHYFRYISSYNYNYNYFSLVLTKNL